MITSFAIGLGCFALSTLGFAMGYREGVKQVRREAIKRGLARWQCIETTGTSYFTWITVDNKET